MKTLSRQRRWQLKHTRAGLCALCHRPRVSKNHCWKHLQYMRKRNLIYDRTKRGVSLDAPISTRGRKRIQKPARKMA